MSRLLQRTWDTAHVSPGPGSCTLEGDRTPALGFRHQQGHSTNLSQQVNLSLCLPPCRTELCLSNQTNLRGKNVYSKNIHKSRLLSVMTVCSGGIGLGAGTSGSYQGSGSSPALPQVPALVTHPENGGAVSSTWALQ